MSQDTVSAAAQLLIEARRAKRLIEHLPPDCRPATAEAALAIQDAVVAGLGIEVGGWKAALLSEGQELMRGVIPRTHIFDSPATVPASLVPLLGIEAEIAFRFLRDLPPRAAEYTPHEVADSVVAMTAIEIVDTRFRDLNSVTPLERLADSFSSGGFVAGPPLPDWQRLELARPRITLAVDGAVVVERDGTQPARDPLRPAIALVNALRASTGVRAGQIVTTGSYTGMNFVKPGQSVRATFESLGTVEVHFTA